MPSFQQTVPETLEPRVANPLSEDLFARFLRFASSVRLGIALLVLLGLACILGMIVMQQNVDGFAKYFAELTPSQRLIYGSLGLFDIYHAWYFNLLLSALSINIIMASIDRFPRTWAAYSKAKITVPIRWLREQRQNAELAFQTSADEIGPVLERSMRAAGWRRIDTAQKNGRSYYLAEKGRWNRFGAYPVHVGLLVIFLGGFLTAQLGSAGQMAVAPGLTSDIMTETVVDVDQTREVTKRLPFEITGVDIQQKLIKKEGPITAINTIDWITRFTIRDETGTYAATTQMNRPFDYRGYRFFQSSFTPVGRARSITVEAIPLSGGTQQTLVLERNATATLGDGVTVNFAEFRGNFRMGPEDTGEDTSDYLNPAAILRVTDNEGRTFNAYAFGAEQVNIPVAGNAIAGYTFRLVDFEKAADRHILAIQRDPGASVVYVGFSILFVALSAVFFFSHQRVWAAVERVDEHSCRVILAGNTNRNLSSFEEKFKKLTDSLEVRST